jgi:hypothetical protein
MLVLLCSRAMFVLFLTAYHTFYEDATMRGVGRCLDVLL